MRSPVAMQLRQHTAATHRRVEATLGLLDPGLTVDRLRAVLSRFAGFWFGIEPAVDGWALANPREALAIDWQRRRRSDVLRTDLRTLGLSDASIDALPCGPAVFGPADPTEAQVLGWLYVSEGSTLGGAVLARSAALMRGLGTFAPYAEGPGPMWRQYLDHLQARVGDDAVLSRAAVHAAAESFDALAAWLAPLAVEDVA